MPSMMFRLRWIVWLAVLLAAVAGAAPIAGLRLIGVQTLPAGQVFEHTVVGGLSGLDYDSAGDRWIVISDDRSERGPARAYGLRLDYDAEQFKAAAVESLLVFRPPGGGTYPNRSAQASPGGEVPDFESLRIDTADGSLWYSSEGDRALGFQPFVRHAARDGKFQGELPLPARFQFSPGSGAGPRGGLVFEGLSFARDGAGFWVALEAPPAEGGPLPTTEQGAATPIVHLARDGRELATCSYPLDAIPVAPAAGKFADNGVSEVLATDDGGLLVLERAGVEGADGVFRFHVRLYAAEPADGGPMRKRLLVDFDRVRPEGADNLEGLSWGRKLPNGHATLVLVSDDNFNATQSTQFWVFEVLSAADAAAPKPQRQWDDLFEGVVHDDRRIAGFVGPYRWLSNYLPCPVTYEGRAYGSTEAAYHASKFPEAERDEFTKLDPDASKKLSRRKKVDQAWWDARKERVMREIVAAKFAQNPELARLLLATGDRELEELNWWGDKFWGTVQGEGRNVLGKILMDVRADIRTRQK